MINYKVIPLGEILEKEYNEHLIEKAFKEFSCQRETDLEDFLMQKAIHSSIWINWKKKGNLLLRHILQ